MAVRVEILRRGDDDRVRQAGSLFDDRIDLAATRAFLDDDRHHLLVAYLEERPVGFVSAVELLHPDAPRPEMFLYELGVDEGFRRRGVATALVQELIVVARERGCREMFVLTDKGNAAAYATYRSAGARPEGDHVMLEWLWTAQGGAST